MLLWHFLIINVGGHLHWIISNKLIAYNNTAKRLDLQPSQAFVSILQISTLLEFKGLDLSKLKAYNT